MARNTGLRMLHIAVVLGVATGLVGYTPSDTPGSLAHAAGQAGSAKRAQQHSERRFIAPTVRQAVSIKDALQRYGWSIPICYRPFALERDTLCTTIGTLSQFAPDKAQAVFGEMAQWMGALAFLRHRTFLSDLDLLGTVLDGEDPFGCYGNAGQAQGMVFLGQWSSGNTLSYRGTSAPADPRVGSGRATGDNTLSYRGASARVWKLDDSLADKIAARQWCGMGTSESSPTTSAMGSFGETASGADVFLTSYDAHLASCQARPPRLRHMPMEGEDSGTHQAQDTSAGDQDKDDGDQDKDDQKTSDDQGDGDDQDQQGPTPTGGTTPAPAPSLKDRAKDVMAKVQDVVKDALTINIGGKSVTFSGDIDVKTGRVYLQATWNFDCMDADSCSDMSCEQEAYVKAWRDTLLQFKYSGCNANVRPIDDHTCYNIFHGRFDSPALSQALFAKACEWRRGMMYPGPDGFPICKPPSKPEVENRNICTNRAAMCHPDDPRNVTSINLPPRVGPVPQGPKGGQPVPPPVGQHTHGVGGSAINRQPVAPAGTNGARQLAPSPLRPIPMAPTAPRPR